MKRLARRLGDAGGFVLIVGVCLYIEVCNEIDRWRDRRDERHRLEEPTDLVPTIDTSDRIHDAIYDEVVRWSGIELGDEDIDLLTRQVHRAVTRALTR